MAWYSFKSKPICYAICVYKTENVLNTGFWQHEVLQESLHIFHTYDPFTDADRALHDDAMNGNAFCIIDPLWRESTGDGVSVTVP